jgi:hypothetical protein
MYINCVEEFLKVKSDVFETSCERTFELYGITQQDFSNSIAAHQEQSEVLEAFTASDAVPNKRHILSPNKVIEILTYKLQYMNDAANH